MWSTCTVHVHQDIQYIVQDYSSMLYSVLMKKYMYMYMYVHAVHVHVHVLVLVEYMYLWKGHVDEIESTLKSTRNLLSPSSWRAHGGQQEHTLKYKCKL